MKLYLAHPLDMRKEIREIELVIEQATGVELLNPFYDTGRNDIYDIDAGRIKKNSMSLNFTDIVETDLRYLDSCEGIVAYIQRGAHSIGTICECWYALMTSAGPVFIVSPDSLNHPWVRYLVHHSGGRGFNVWEEFEAFLLDK